MAFGETNNWKNSKWRKYLNSEYYQEISDEFGKENINEHEVDLTSMDGYDDYGTVRDKVSAMTIGRYRRYHKYIGNVSEWNYLSTPDSTPSGWSASGVQWVSGGGSVGYAGCRYVGALRPFSLRIMGGRPWSARSRDGLRGTKDAAFREASPRARLRKRQRDEGSCRGGVSSRTLVEQP